MDNRYDTDPDALAWARAKVQHQLDRLAKFEEQATATGKTDQARGLSLARRSTQQMLIGGEGCVIGAFDERRPQILSTPESEPATVPNRLRKLVDDVAAQLHDEDPASYHGDGGPSDCQRCADVSAGKEVKR